MSVHILNYFSVKQECVMLERVGTTDVLHNNEDNLDSFTLFI